MSRPLKAAPGSQSLERGLDVLEVVEAEGGDIGVREIARRLELSPTIVQRMVTSLARRGYVDRNAETARYRLGYRALALGANSEHGSDYIGTARRELELLARGQSLNGFISVLHGGRAVYLLAVQAEGPVAIKVAPGSEMPLHSTAAGKVLLASQSDAEARKLLGQGKLAARGHDVVGAGPAVGAERPRPMAQPIARRLAVLVDIAAPGERGHHALHDGRAKLEPARDLAHADLATFGFDDLEHVETAFERLRSRRRFEGARHRGRAT